MPLNLKIFVWLIFSTIAFFPYTTNAQLDIWPHLKDIGLKFDSETNEKIADIYLDKRIADDLIARIASAEDKDKGEVEDAFKNLFSASRALYDVYDAYSGRVRGELPAKLPADYERCSVFKQIAEANMEKAGVLRKEAAGSESVSKAVSLYEMAFDLELIALLHKARAIRIYQDYPIIYAYPWDDDYTIMDHSPRNAIRVVEIDESGEMVEPVSDNTGLKDGIYYIIQIAAHTSKLSNSELNAIYNGNRDINMLQEDSWYKYYFGPYRRYEEAEKTLNSLNLRNMFIAAYIDGNRVEVAEARRREATQN